MGTSLAEDTLTSAQPPDMVTAPKSLFFSRPGRLYWRKLGKDKVQEVDQSRQGDSGQKLSEEIFFFALCCLGKIPGGVLFSQLHKAGKQRRVDRS